MKEVIALIALGAAMAMSVVGFTNNFIVGSGDQAPSISSTSHSNGPAPLPPNGPPTCQSCHYRVVYGGRMGVSLVSPFVPHN